MKSPCISRCIYDFKLNHCAGCFRTLTEIGDWEKMSPTEQRETLDRCQERKSNTLPNYPKVEKRNTK